MTIMMSSNYFNTARCCLHGTRRFRRNDANCSVGAFA